jgi:peptide/nickel transport system substrate-binding protein
MRTRSKRLGGLMAIAAASVLTVGACGTSGGGGEQQQSSAGFATCEQKPNDCNSGKTKPGGSIVYTLEKKIPNWNTFDSEGNVFETAQVMNGLVPSPYVAQPDGTMAWNKHLLAEEPKLTSQSPQTIVYKIRKEAVWDDKTPISSKDFQLYWKFNNGTDCAPKSENDESPSCTSASTAGYKSIKSVEGSDGDKTVTVTFKDGETFPDWKGLFAIYPSQVAAKAGDLNTREGLIKAFNAFKETPTWSGWAYKISDYQKDVSVTVVPNPNWYGPKPALEKITFRIIEDQAQHAPALRNKEVQVLNSQPNGDLVQQVQGMVGVNFNLAKGSTWEHLDLNTKNPALADVELRKAIFTALNRQEIIDKTVGTFFKGAAPLNSHNMLPGGPGYKDVITPTGQGKGDAEAAKKILTAAGYKIEGGKLIGKNGQPVPPLRYVYTTGNVLRQQSGELIQNQMKAIGVDIKITPTAGLGKTLAKSDFDLILFAYVATPLIASNRDLWHSTGESNWGKWSNPEADKLLDQASKELDDTKMRDLFNQADEIMSKEAYVMPMFQKPVFIAVYSDYINIRNNPNLNGQTYNIEEWGLKAE